MFSIHEAAFIANAETMLESGEIGQSAEFYGPKKPAKFMSSDELHRATVKAHRRVMSGMSDEQLIERDIRRKKTESELARLNAEIEAELADDSEETEETVLCDDSDREVSRIVLNIDKRIAAYAEHVQEMTRLHGNRAIGKIEDSNIPELPYVK